MAREPKGLSHTPPKEINQKSITNSKV
jgi:hypothetical protein